MNQLEYLLTCLIEECAEVQKVATKAQRFGLDHHGPGEEKPNVVLLGDEFADLIAVAKMLNDDLHKPIFKFGQDRRVRAKKWKMHKMIRYSRQCGTLR